MAFAISTPTSSLLYSSSSSSSTSGGKTSSLCSFSNSAIPIPRNAILHHTKSIPQLGFAQWNGLKQIVISTSQCTVKIERRGKGKGKGVYASLFGVGAPEVLVIGVVALLVFGPKGLAEVARNLGQTLRAFQPTIKELQEVSREFKSTLEREIGLDDINTPVPKRPSSSINPTSEDIPQDSVPNVEPSAEDPDDKYLKVSADRFRGALAQLQKEQEEEKEKEKEEKEKELLQAQMQEEPESLAPPQDTPQALDVDTEEASSVTPPTENLDNNVLQEAGSVASTGPATKIETQI